MLSLHQRGSGRTRVIAGIAAILSASSIPTLVHAGDSATLTPIKHVIIIIGENRTFDHIFATYAPVNKGEFVMNLMSQGIEFARHRRFAGPVQLQQLVARSGRE